MRVLVTGGIGAVGKTVVERLLHSGWDVRVIDRRADFEMAGIDYQTCDINNYADVREQVRGGELLMQARIVRSLHQRARIEQVQYLAYTVTVRGNRQQPIGQFIARQLANFIPCKFSRCIQAHQFVSCQ